MPATAPELFGNIAGTCAKIAPSAHAQPAPTRKPTTTAFITTPERPASVMPNIVTPGAVQTWEASPSSGDA